MDAIERFAADVAHEIKNPLNFVNNFASLSVELLGELKETTAPALATLDAAARADADDTMDLLTGNLDKIIAALEDEGADGKEAAASAP